MIRLPSLASLLALALLGCPSEPPPSVFEDCEAIVEACHEPDEAGAGGMVSTCHDISHDADSNDDCAPFRAECVAVCSAFDGGVPIDAGAIDVGEHEHEDGGDHEH